MILMKEFYLLVQIIMLIAYVYLPVTAFRRPLMMFVVSSRVVARVPFRLSTRRRGRRASSRLITPAPSMSTVIPVVETTGCKIATRALSRASTGAVDGVRWMPFSRVCT